MNNKGLVSIVIPAYNPPFEKFEKCINSILVQDYEFKEVIVIDDGSRKEISEVMDDYMNNNNIIKVIHQTNGGEGAARNSGIDKAEGEYIIFVDADDALAEGWITYAVDLAIKNKADVVSGRVIMCNDVDEVLGDSKSNYYLSKCFAEHEIWQVQKDFLYDSSELLDGLPLLDPGVCSKLIRRDLIKDKRFPIGIKLSSDQVFNQCLVRNSKSYVITNREAYYYVMNSESISHIYQPAAVDYMMHSMTLVKDNLLNNSDVWQSYYYRVFIEITSAIQFAYYSERKKCNLSEKLKGIKYAGNQSLVQEAACGIDLKQVSSKPWKIKMYLIRKKWYLLYLFLKEITDFKDRL